jgi:hypothetical protein
MDSYLIRSGFLWDSHNDDHAFQLFCAFFVSFSVWVEMIINHEMIVNHSDTIPC